MRTELVLSLFTITVLMKTTSTQFYANQYYENMPQQYYQEQPEQQEADYEDPMEHVHTRRSESKYFGSSGGKFPIMDYEDDESVECRCSCRRCKNTRKPPKPCCRETCLSCSDMQYQPGQGSFIFVPYPYPLMVPNSKNDTTTATTKTTTPTTTAKPNNTGKDSSEWNITSSESGPYPLGRSHMKNLRKSSMETINDLILRSPHNLKGDRKYMLTSMRKTKPAWEPKYGIVPIPDNLAEKLMSQLRQVRELQARRF